MYFITGLTSLDPSHKSRCLGYYRDKHEALSAVNENRGGFDQGIYDYLVIERIGEGIHAIAEEETWFRWVNLVGSYHDRGYWEEMPKPPEMARLGNHAIG